MNQRNVHFPLVLPPQYARAFYTYLKVEPARIHRTASNFMSSLIDANKLSVPTSFSESSRALPLPTATSASVDLLTLHALLLVPSLPRAGTSAATGGRAGSTVPVSAATTSPMMQVTSDIPRQPSDASIRMERAASAPPKYTPEE
eukprot:scaffold223836_cov32-Tisochrysis_lutea.AAC.2